MLKTDKSLGENTQEKFEECNRFSLACGRMHKKLSLWYLCELEYAISIRIAIAISIIVKLPNITYWHRNFMKFLVEQVEGRTNYDDFVCRLLDLLRKLHPECVQRMSIWCCGYRYNCWLLYLYLFCCGIQNKQANRTTEMEVGEWRYGKNS